MAYINKVWRGPANGPFMSALVEEALAAEVLQPGRLVEINVSGLAQAPVNFDATAPKAVYVVLEHDASTPEGATALVNQAFLADSLVVAAYPRAGELFGLVVPPGTAIEKGQPYTIDANGFVTPAGVGEVALFTPTDTVATDGSNAQFAEFVKL